MTRGSSSLAAPGRGADDTVSDAPRWTRADAVVILIVGCAALVHLPFPFTGDQALFAHAARGMRHGDQLYVDFWDLKQPGIYAWYKIVGTLFGFREVGIHSGEVLTLVVLARVTQIAVRDEVEHRVVASLAPIFTVGAYIASARPWDLTQVESFVALPLVALIANGRVDELRRKQPMAAGVLCGVVAWLKFLYLPIAIAIVVRQFARSTERSRDAIRVAAGFGAVMAPLAVYSVVNGIVGELWWTFFEYPFTINSLDPRPLSRLRDGVEFVARMHAWLIPFALVAWVRPARAARAGRSRGTTADATVWFIVGWIVLLTQQWWGYHFFVPLVPLGLLATIGLDRLLCAARGMGPLPVTASRRGALVVGALTIALVVIPAKQYLHKVRTVVDDSGDVLRREWNPDYADIGVIVAPLSVAHRDHATLTRAGPIHVLGDPLILLRADRAAAIAQNGWSPEFWDTKLWNRHRDELAEAIDQDAIAYMWIEDVNARLWRTRSFDTWRWMVNHFRPKATIGNGTWFAPRK